MAPVKKSPKGNSTRQTSARSAALSGFGNQPRRNCLIRDHEEHPGREAAPEKPGSEGDHAFPAFQPGYEHAQGEAKEHLGRVPVEAEPHVHRLASAHAHNGSPGRDPSGRGARCRISGEHIGHEPAHPAHDHRGNPLLRNAVPAMPTPGLPERSSTQAMSRCGPGDPHAHRRDREGLGRRLTRHPVARRSIA
jgi:hypothetical protein